MNKQLLYFLINVGILSLGSVLGASVAPRITTPSSTQVLVTASFYPLAEFAEQIGREKVQVKNLTPAGVEPHDFEPTPQDIMQLQNSQLFIYSNAGIEQWADRLIPTLTQINIVKASRGMQLRVQQNMETDDESNHSQTRTRSYDPHFWLDPVLASQAVENILEGLTATDPDNRVFYEANARAYQNKLKELNEEFNATLQKCGRRDIVTSHNAFSYLADRYNLQVISLAGISPDEEPSPQRLAQVAEFAHQNNVTYIFFETLISPRLANTIAREVGAKTLVFNPLEGLSKEELEQGKEYISVQQENLRNLSTALECQ